MNTPTNQPQKIGYLFLFNTIFFFSTYEVVNKIIIGKVDAFQVNFIRFLIGGLILLVYAYFKKEAAISLKDFGLCTIIGVINVVISMSFINMSLCVEGASAAVTAVLFSCNPIFVAIFASIFEGESLEVKKIVALALGIIGTVLISFNKMHFDVNSLLSPLFAVLSALFFGLYTVMGRKVTTRIGSLRMNAYSFIGGSIVLWFFLLFMKRPILQFDYSVIGWVFYLALFVTGLAYLTYFKGLAYIGAGKGSLLFFLKPVIATGLAVAFLNEIVNILMIIGMILILLGIWIIYGNQFKIKQSELI